MNKLINIQSLEQIPTSEGCNVIFKLEINGKPYELKYNIIHKDISSIPVRCDAVVVTFLPLALRFGMDIRSTLPISKVLYYNITKQLIPQINLCNPDKTYKINLDMPYTDETYSGNWKGTGISLGVDSFATLHEYFEDCLFDEYKLTHLVHLKTGAHRSYSLKGYNSDTEHKLYKAEHNNVIKYCKANNFDLVTIESNLDSIIRAEFELSFVTTYTFRNLGAILLIQDRFEKFYYASGYNMDQFKLDLCDDSAHYEKWLLPLLANENITFYSSNDAMSRLEKIKYISQFSDTYDFLHVCWMSEHNCGRCAKCVRTLTHLDALNILDLYKNAFDVEHYKANRRKYLRIITAKRHRDYFYNETYNFMKQKGEKMPGAIEVIPTKIHLLIKYILRKPPFLQIRRKLKK